MAWPPPVLPINRSNATPQQDIHPTDHNAIGQAVNDTVARVQFLETALSRHGTINNQPGQVYTGGQVAVVAWETVTDPAFGTGPTIVIPAGRGGVYTATLRVGGPDMPAGYFAGVFLSVKGLEYPGAIIQGQSAMVLTVSLVLEDGSPIYVTIYNPLTTSQYYSAQISLLRVSA